MTSTAKRLWALDAPTMTLEASGLVVGGQGMVTIPVPAFLIEHERALVLFDTGFAPVVSDNPAEYFGDMLEVLKINSSPEQRIDRQLARLGFRLEDVTHVVLSHTHSDHTGGLSLFPPAKFYIGPGEFDWAQNPSAASAHLFRWAGLLAPVKSFDWTILQGPVLDLLGDGSLTILHTPGHTPGELSLMVRLPSQTMVLTADTVHLREGLDRNQPDPIDWDHDAARASLGILRSLEAAGNRLWISHDPDDWKALGSLREHS